MLHPEANFFTPRPAVSIIALGEPFEALTIRALLEHLGFAVTLHLPGIPRDFLSLLALGVAAPQTLIISAHGTRDGFVIGDVDPDIDPSLRANGVITPSLLAGRVALPGCTVISTACCSAIFGDVFCAAAAYIAPHDYPSGNDVMLFIHLLFYEMIERSISAVVAIPIVSKRLREQFAVQ